MKLYTFTLLTILLLSFACFGQTEQPKTIDELKQQIEKFKFEKRYSVKYDKFEDRTNVKCIGFDLMSFGEGVAATMAQTQRGLGRAPIASLRMGTGFFFSGETLKQTQNDYLWFFLWTGEEWQFLRNSKLIALIDGERMEFGSGERDSIVKYGGVAEIVGFILTKEEMLKLANAKTVEIRIGTYEKKLKPEWLAMFADTVKLGDLSERAEVKKKK